LPAALRTVPDQYEKPSATVLCADAHGCSQHAGVRYGEHQRNELERLCRYTMRPACDHPFPSAGNHRRLPSARTGAAWSGIRQCPVRAAQLPEAFDKLRQ